MMFLKTLIRVEREPTLITLPKALGNPTPDAFNFKIRSKNNKKKNKYKT